MKRLLMCVIGLLLTTMGFQAAAQAPAKAEDEKTTSIRARAAAAVKKATDAVRLEGSEEAAKVTADFVRLCTASMSKRRECLASMKNPTGGIDAKQVGRTAGVVFVLAYDVVRPNSTSEQVLAAEESVKGAEAFAQIAADMAKDINTARTSLEAERGPIEAARTECAANATTCKTKCDGGAATFCVARAEQLQKATKLTEAKAVATKACDLKNQTACLLVDRIDEDIAAKTAATDTEWTDMQEIGDDLARKQHQAEMVLKMANTPRLQMTAQRMRTINAAIVTERLCPAKKAFIANDGVVEYQKRAAAHCKDDAPTASGLSGAQITLTAKCQAAFATTCQ